ncbi:MAG: helix-turn-helix transcriptional regulator [Gammaproteobacteria bacterium]|nr:helix-turn-helix transcriptional regulator [Gammaproteobacteria bacterium]MDH5729994.1 helix-turn-helix transcriptional regulator [Gammaproteobacteria bacterium]
MELENNLAYLRKQQGLTQDALAEKVAVTRQTIISIEKGRFTPSTKLALLIARELNQPLESIFWLRPSEKESLS